MIGTRRRHHSAHRRRLFAPQEPDILSGEFAGRKLSELSDEELNRFIQRDASSQFGKTESSLLARSNRFYWDHSQYWFARYELERRKPDAERETAASLNIGDSDTPSAIAQKLVDFGWKAASRKFHPDRGGDNGTMQKLNAARDFARDRLSVAR